MMMPGTTTTSKIDLLNSHLDKKINKSSFDKYKEKDDLIDKMIGGGNGIKKILPSAFQPKSFFNDKFHSSGAVSFLEAVKSLSKEIKDNFKQSSLT
jgi:hypothetical protein